MPVFFAGIIACIIGVCVLIGSTESKQTYCKRSDNVCTLFEYSILKRQYVPYKTIPLNQVKGVFSEVTEHKRRRCRSSEQRKKNCNVYYLSKLYLKTYDTVYSMSFGSVRADGNSRASLPDEGQKKIINDFNLFLKNSNIPEVHYSEDVYGIVGFLWSIPIGVCLLVLGFILKPKNVKKYKKQSLE